MRTEDFKRLTRNISCINLCMFGNKTCNCNREYCNFVVEPDLLNNNQLYPLATAIESSPVLESVTIKYKFTTAISLLEWLYIFGAIARNPRIHTLRLDLSSNRFNYRFNSAMGNALCEALYSAKHVTTFEILSDSNVSDMEYIAGMLVKNTSIKYLKINTLSVKAKQELNNQLWGQCSLLTLQLDNTMHYTKTWDKLWQYKSYLFRSWLVRNRNHPLMDPRAFRAVGKFLPEIVDLKDISEIFKIWGFKVKCEAGNVVAGNPKYLIINSYKQKCLYKKEIKLTYEGKKTKEQMYQEKIKSLQAKIAYLEKKQFKLISYIAVRENNPQLLANVEPNILGTMKYNKSIKSKQHSPRCSYRIP